MHLRSKIETFVLAFAQPQTDAQYKIVARDFLIELKEFAATDNTELFREEKELEAKQREAHALSVPGMVKPVLLPDQDEAL